MTRPLVKSTPILKCATETSSQELELIENSEVSLVQFRKGLIA